MRTAIVAITMGLLALVGASSHQSAASVSGTIVVTARLSATQEDGGRLITTKTLRDSHGNIIGWGDTVCFPLLNSSYQCVGTFILPRGKLMVAGTRHNQSFFVLGIVGGTGIYVAAGGTLIGNMIDTSPRTQRLVFSLS